MIHEYCKILPDTENIIVTFTDIHSSPTRGESITVRFERADNCPSVTVKNVWDLPKTKNLNCGVLPKKTVR